MAVSLGYKEVYRYPEGFPEWQQRGLPVEVSGLSGTREDSSAGSTAPPAGLALLLTFVGVFLGGIALNLTPCVYPLIPITVSYFGGRSGRDSTELVLHGVCYIIGLAITNSILGVGAALTGGLLGGLLQNSWVLAGVAAVLLLFASSLFGFWEISLPTSLTNAASRSYTGYFGSLFMGLTLGIIAAPCIGPFILGLITWVAAVGRVWFGFLVFFVLSLGLGLPLFILALFSGSLEKLPRSGEWMLWIRKLMGWILVGMAAYFIRSLVSESVAVALYTGVALSAAVHLGWIEKSSSPSPLFRWIRRATALMILLFGLIISGSYLSRGPGVDWQDYSEPTLLEAQQNGKPVIMDFYASWCSPCRELDEKTFHDKDVVRMSEDFVMLKIDLTKDDNPAHQTLIERYQVKGVPTIIFLDSKGVERRDLRLFDYLPPAGFVKLMEQM